MNRAFAFALQTYTALLQDSKFTTFSILVPNIYSNTENHSSYISLLTLLLLSLSLYIALYIDRSISRYIYISIEGSVSFSHGGLSLKDEKTKHGQG